MYEAETYLEDASLDTSESTPLRWPPPGLEALQGLAWRAIALLAAGTGIMVTPMFVSVARAHSFWSIGLFGGSWWIPVVAAFAGLLILLAGMERLTRMLFDGAKAVQRGHDWMTVAYVLSDARHDAGFLLQGARQYSSLPERDRRMLLAARVVAVTGYAASLIWIPVAFTLGVILAGRGVIGGGGGLSALVLVPGGMMMMAAVLADVFETRTTRGMARAWRRETTSESKLLDEVGEWRADRATRLIHLTPATHRTTPARAVAIAFIVLAIMLPVPIATLALTSAIGPAVGQMAIPRIASSAARIAKASMLQPYAVATTDEMSATEAGAVLHALAFTGTSASLSPLEREPVRRYDPWPRESKPVTMPNLEAFGTQLIPRADALTAEEIAYLERIAQYPALADLSRLARARAADIAGARWNTTQLAGASLLELPVARFSGLRDATQFHTAKAILELSRGNAAAADTTLREVISIGLLVMREGPTLIDVLVGTSIAANGAAALQSLYRATDRHGEADALLRPQEGIERMEQVTRALYVQGDVDALLRRSMAMTTNDAIPRGMRWESLRTVQVGAGCRNPHSVVFGHGSDYAEWLEASRKSLVRYPSEQALFEMSMGAPMLPSQLHRRATIVQRLFGITLGRDAASTCAAMAAGLSAS
ncbi:MAG TPA: hypothetical protein VHG09_09550 [Longimicrobiales bacterium]|nr:hypothetical protein [Longimicrobiales bacterium]